MIALVSNIAQDSISIPVIYIESFIMMLGAFVIGYIGATIATKVRWQKNTQKLQARIDSLKKQIKELQEDQEYLADVPLRKDRMDQEMEQVQFQKRAFSEHVLAETVEVLDPKAINFDRIGRARKEERDDLQQIIGIGPYTETKLNDLGIYTYEQISKFSDEDIATVTELIKFFPDRIKNDRWVPKAIDLSAKKAKENGSPDGKKKKIFN